MLALLDQAKEPVAASQAEATIARSAIPPLKKVAAAKKDVKLMVQGSPEIILPLPARAVCLILRILEAMADRVPVSVIPMEAELTTQQAADYLNVSRPYLVSLLEKDEISYRKVGRHRRVKFGDLLEFERASRKERSEAIASLVRDAQELGLE
jgi:excisionase family DNA binding protein